MNFFVVSFATPNTAAYAAVVTYLKTLQAEQVAESSYALSLPGEDPALFERLERLLRDGHLWVMRAWERPEITYMANRAA